MLLIEMPAEFFYQLRIDEEKRMRLDGLKTGVKDS